MCTTCGCSDVETRVTAFQPPASDHHLDRGHHHDPGHSYDPGHRHDHEHAVRATTPATTHTIEIEQRVLAKNDLLAARNRGWLADRDIQALNMMSSPGAGKTSLLVRSIKDIGSYRSVAVIEGDQETLLDAERIRATGAQVVQINTGAGCHLDAEMLHSALDALDPPSGSLLFIENVGNLVCPALFDLGEHGKVVVISVTEGDDKPLKYPHMFAAADLVVVNKIDLLPYVEFDVDACAANARRVNPGLHVLALSVTTGAGLDEWYAWLRNR